MTRSPSSSLAAALIAGFAYVPLQPYQRRFLASKPITADDRARLAAAAQKSARRNQRRLVNARRDGGTALLISVDEIDQFGAA